ASGIGAWRDDEVVLQLLLVGSVVDEIDPWVDILIQDARVVGDARVPLRGVVADEVIRPAHLRIEPDALGGKTGAYGLRPQDGIAGRRMQAQDRFVPRQKQAVALAAGEELDLTVGLADVGLEAERRLQIGL